MLLSIAVGLALLGGSAAAFSPPAAAAPAGFLLVNHNSLLCLYASPGPGERPVTQRRCDLSSNNYRWEHLPWGGDPTVVRLRHRATNLCLVTRGTGESKAVLSTCGAWSDQIWTTLLDQGAEVYRYGNMNSGLCLVARGTVSGTRAIQSTCGAQWDDQFWRQLR
jgi:hypothetical protein